MRNTGRKFTFVRPVAGAARGGGADKVNSEMIESVDRLVGFQRGRELLERRMAAGRTGGSYLFSGLYGIGKTQFALCFARVLFCRETPEAEFSFCGECVGCQGIQRASAGDFTWLFPDGKFISQGLVNRMEVARKGFQRPTKHPWRVFVIDECEKLNETSGNQLLKTLEESSPTTVFLLITDSEHGMLPTIRSRCHRVPLSPAHSDALGRELKARGIDWPEELVRALNGRCALAFNLAELDNPAQRVGTYAGRLAGLLDGREAGSGEATERFTELAEDLADLLMERERERLELVFGEPGTEGDEQELEGSRENELRRVARAAVADLGLRMALTGEPDPKRAARIKHAWLRLLNNLRYNVTDQQAALDLHLSLLGETEYYSVTQ